MEKYPTPLDKNSSIASKIATFLYFLAQVSVYTYIDPILEDERKKVQIMFEKDTLCPFSGILLSLSHFRSVSGNILNVLSTRFEISIILIANGFVNNEKTLNDKTYKISHDGIYYSINDEFSGSSVGLCAKLREMNLIE